MEKINISGLYLVLTDPVAGYEHCTAAAVACGVAVVQLRMKGAAPAEVVSMGRRLRTIVNGSATRLIINDDVAAAREIDAHGLHLGQDDMPLAEARRMWPAPGKIFGLSTHNMRQAAEAVAQGPDYIGVGPVFATPTKAVADPVVGLAEMGAIIRATPLPCVAIGGIDRGRLAAVAAHGAATFAVVRAVTRAADPAAAIGELQAAWRAACFSA